MNVTKELATLKQLGMNDLRARYAKVFGETTHAGNRDFLIKRIIWRMQSKEEGTLSERALRRAEELADEAYLRTTIPKVPATGGHEVVLDAPRTSGLPMPGAVLTRQYKGRTIRVTVLADGFDYDGNVYPSLSAVAKAITGSHWNGNLFFGIGQKRKGQ